VNPTLRDGQGLLKNLNQSGIGNVMERIISMIIRHVAMRALRGGLNRSKSKPNGVKKPQQTAEQQQAGRQDNQARKLGRMVRRIGRF